MNKYEMLYIIAADLADEAKEAIIAKFENAVNNNGGKVEKVDKWGLKKLVYPINYKTEGYYVLMSFESTGALVDELKRIAGITDGVVRRLITKA
jgi:small subunit ribosomal protein S6